MQACFSCYNLARDSAEVEGRFVRRALLSVFERGSDLNNALHWMLLSWRLGLLFDFLLLLLDWLLWCWSLFWARKANRSLKNILAILVIEVNL